MTTALLLVSLLLQGAIGAPDSEELGSIEGTVHRRGTRQPLPDTLVTLISDASPNPEDWTRPLPSFTTRTDSQGKFLFEDVAPGGFILGFAANGYVLQEYGQRTFPGRGAKLRLASGETLRNLNVELTPTGSVNGTVRDEDGRPLVGVPVQLMRPSFDNDGDHMLRPFGTEVVTDDRGEYRIYLVTPGRYYVNAGTPQGPPGTGDPRLGPNQVPVFYTSKFYPGATDIQFANELEVRPGTEVRGIDFTLARQAGVSVSGRILNATTGPLPEDADVDLEYRDPGTGWDYGLDYRGRSEAIYEDGRFEFQNVLPGLYTLTAAVDDPAAPEGVDLKRFGYIPVEVAGSDLEDLALTVYSGGTIFGRVTAEERPSVEDAFIRDTPLGVSLGPSRNGGRPATPGLPAPTYGELNPDGTFRIDNIMPGEYRLTVSWLRDNFYVKSARFGTADLRTGVLDFTGRETATLEIVISPNVASVEGAVTDDALNAVEGAQVVLVPDVARHRPELFKAVRTDQRGRFTIPDIAPGDYKLYAWEAIEPYGWFDLELADRYAAEAVSLSLGESDRRQVNAALIPLAPQ